MYESDYFYPGEKVVCVEPLKIGFDFEIPFGGLFIVKDTTVIGGILLVDIGLYYRDLPRWWFTDGNYDPNIPFFVDAKRFTTFSSWTKVLFEVDKLVRPYGIVMEQ